MRLMRMRLRFRSLGLALLSVAAAGVLLQIGPAQASSKKARRSTASATKQQALAAYGKLPLAFTANAGQTDPRVRYSAQGAGFSVFLTRREAMLALQRPGKQRRGKGAALALRFLGSNRNVAIRGERPGPGRVNYLLGNDPAKWHTGLRTYERVVYRNLWPGVDMVFAGQNGKLKYEFLVRPGARVSDIRLAYRGAKRLSLDRQGNLRIRTSLGVLTDTRPASYQLVAGKRVPVRSSFALQPHGRGYGFAAESAYDRRYPLVIDPGLAYSTYLGGSASRLGLRHRGRRRRQRLPHRVHGLGGLPDDRGRLRHDLQRRRRRLRDEARRERRRPRLLHLPGRKQRSTTAPASRSTAPAPPTSPASRTRWTSRRPRAPSTRPTTGRATPS